MRISSGVRGDLGLVALWLAVFLTATSCATGFVDQGDVRGGDADGVDGTSEGTGDGLDVDPDVVEAGDGEPEDGGPEDGEEATVCGPPGACDDGVPCTEDSCDEGTARCVHEPRASLCDDGNPCTGAEVCDVVLDCIAGTPVDCDDDAACTDDACLPATGACDHVVNCTAPQVCDPVGGNCADPSSCTVDADCNDGNFCTGIETCESAWRCRPGTPPACDDGLACSADRCDPAAAGGAGACVADPPDLDGDLHGSAACLGDDCNDGDASVHPGASEACNAVDDDCDGSTDETFACPRGASGACTVGACTGVRTCSAACTWGTCTVSTTEVCNGLDDDCDGVADEGFGCVRGATRACTLGACSGAQTCGTACSWGTCTVSTPESCNGLDDNCNGAIDETFSCSLGSTGGCTNSCGAAGSRTCAAPSCSWGACCGVAEVCGNTCDDDCDGTVNEGCGPACTVVEGFESGVWPAPGWSGGSGSVLTSAAHDGSYGIQDPDWPYRTDVTFGSPGERMTAWVRPGTGRVYLGFAASASGCKSFVAAPNTTDIRFQDNAGWGFVELNTSPQTFATGAWYKMEVEFYAGNAVTGRLYASDGTTLLNSVSQTFSSSVTGGVALRTFGGFATDTISVCR